jgi:nucleotide-binding universal stress UspA family protein
VLVSFDGSDRACAALADGAVAARASGGRLTVLALAAVEEPMRCCNMQTTFWNREMRRLAQESISRARSLVDPALDADFVIRRGSRRRDIAAAAVELGCDVIVEPTRSGRSRHRLVSL